MKNILFVFITLCCTMQYAEAQNKIRINGHVKGDSVENLSSITVTLIGGEKKWRTRTDTQGNFEFQNIKAGSYQLVFTASAYKKLVLLLPHLKRDTILKVEIFEQTGKLDVVNVYGERIGNTKKVSPSLRLSRPILQLPQNINVINNSTFADQQITALGDGLLRNVSGAQRLEHWGDLYTRVNMRGGRAAAFLNGVNVTSNWGPLSEDMSYVERIEIVKGPAGFMMSNGEPSGIYNVVTKKPTATVPFQGAVKSTIGSFGMYRGEVDIDGKFIKNIAFRLNGMMQTKNSFRPHEFNDRYVFAPSLLFKISNQTSLTTEYIYQKAKMTQVGSAYVFSFDGYASKPRNYTLNDANIAPSNIEDHTVNLNLQHHFNADWMLTAQGTYINDYMLGSNIWPSLFDKASQKMIRNLSFWESSNVMKFGQWFVNGKIQTGKVTHHILSGFDYGHKKYLADWRQNGILDKFNASGSKSKADSLANFDYWYNTLTNNYDINGASPYLQANNGYPTFDGKTKTLKERATPGGTIFQQYAGFYAQDELGFLDEKLRLTLAARFTYVTQSAYGGIANKAHKITPRVGVSYSIEKNTSVYALFDQAFTPQTGIFRNGDKARPLTGNNTEIGFKKDWNEGKWNTTFSLYRIVMNNGITRDPTNTAGEQFSIILGKTRVRGLEFDIKGRIIDGLNVMFNYAFTQNNVIESNSPLYVIGSRIAGYSKHTANTWIGYTLQNGVLKGTGVNLGGTFLGDRSTWSWSNNPNSLQLNDYMKFDAGIHWSNAKLDCTFNVFNVLDRYLYSGASFPFTQADDSSQAGYYYQAEAPRNFRLSIGYKF